MADWLEEHGVALVVLAGYMHLLTPAFLERFPDRDRQRPPVAAAVVPGPATRSSDALAAGVETTGVTVHLVDEGVDTGPVLRQEPVPVEPRETLVERIHAVEHRLLPGGGARAVRALISVYDKSGLDEFARGLAELGCELVASGGTAAFLEEHGLAGDARRDVTGFAEMLGHRVVTLHPAVHGGILARRDVPDDLADLADARDRAVRPRRRQPLPVHARSPRATASREEEAVEMIDIGGPALLRAAAKNFAHVAPVARPGALRATCSPSCASTASCRSTRAARSPPRRSSSPPRTSRRSRAWFADREAFPEGLIPTFWKDRNLAYGENPHQRAAYYAEAGARRHLLSRVEQLARAGALVQQPQRPLGARGSSSRSSRCRPA